MTSQSANEVPVNDIALHAVQSANVAKVGYDSNRKRLAIQFHKSSTIYQYADVPGSVADGLMSAKSPGSYVGQHIVGKFTTIKTRPAED